jgi:pimeloyl-ACP methyl ester carboxylesterase
MLGYLTRIIFSSVISLMLFSVPKEKYQTELNNLPTIEQRNRGFDLRGWQFRRVHSPRTGFTHSYYEYPSSKKDAPLLVCLHGFNTDGRIFMNLSPLSEYFTIISYNFPERTKLYTGTFSDFVPVLDDFFQTIDADTINIIGLSIGGGITIHYAGSQPGVEITSLVLVSTCICGGTESDRKRSIAMGDKLLKYPDYKLYYLLKRSRHLVSRIEKTGLGESAPAELIAIKQIAWYRQILNAMYGYNGAEYARNISCPVFVIHGDNDRVVSLESGTLIPQYIPQASMEVIPGGGHSIVYTEGKKITALISGFYTR